MTPDEQRLLEELRRDLGLLTYRVDKHGGTIRDHEVRVRIIEDDRASSAVLHERVDNLASDLTDGFNSQGDEIKSLRRSVVAAAISIAGSAIVLLLTQLPH
jgi:hypothetical protein